MLDDKQLYLPLTSYPSRTDRERTHTSINQSKACHSLCARIDSLLLFADGVLSLGDEILSVNGRSLLGLNHSQAVEVLQSSGPVVTLCVRPNHTYRGVHALRFDYSLMLMHV